MKYSIIIPTYNRAERLKNLLVSLNEMDYNKNEFEVIIIDDGSRDNTPEIINRYSGELCHTYLRQENSGPSLARNRGIDIAAGEFICFIDDDCTVMKDWLNKADKFLENGFDGICGIGIDKAGTIYSSASQFITNSLFKLINNYFNNAVFVMSNNLIYRRNIFNTIEKFSVEFKRPGGEDRELNLRIINAGYKIAFSENLFINHYHHQNLKSFLHQQFNYGIGALVLKRILKTEKLKNYNTPLSIYLKIIPEIYGKFGAGKGFIVFLLFILSQISAISGMVYCKYFIKSEN